jgi:hypothetical protein
MSIPCVRGSNAKTDGKGRYFQLHVFPFLYTYAIDTVKLFCKLDMN